MERIDFLGANSVGKSTLLEALTRRRDGDRRWLTRPEAKRRVATDRFVDQWGPRDLVKAASCHLPRLGEVFVEAFTRRPAEEAYAEADPQWHDFYEYCLKKATDREKASSPESSLEVADGALDGTSRHLVRAPKGAGSRQGEAEKGLEPMHCVNLSWLFSRLTELCLLQDLDERVVFDESLAHSTAGLLQEMPSETAVRSHFEKMPEPDAVVHLTAPVETVVERIYRRNTDDAAVLRHRDADEQQLRKRTRRALHIAGVGASTLEWQGVEVLSVDMTADFEDNVRQVEEFIGA